MRSLTSRPDSGEAMALATDAMSECSDRLKSSKPGERKREGKLKMVRQLSAKLQILKKKWVGNKE